MNYYSYDDTKPVVASSATTYLIKFKPTGWAIYNVDNTYGSLSIISDWGNWSRIWSADPKSLGAPNFSSFLAKAGLDYLACKLLDGVQDQLDMEATITNIKKEVLRARRRLEISEEAALERWEDLKQDFEDENDIIRFFSTEGDFDYDTLQSLLEYKPGTEYTILTELLLPAIQTHLKALCETV